MPKKKILVFQHVEHEGLENIEKFFPYQKFEFTRIKFYKNQKIPENLDVFSMMIVLGGPMDTWMEKKYPWLINEKKSIKKFVHDLQKPFLGICLGCQLLGEILGAKILKSKVPEIGFYKINTQKKLNDDRIFKYLPKSFDVFQWHSYEVNGIKDKDFKVLASSKTTKVQLFKYKDHAYGMQFHLEINNNTIENWFKLSSNRKQLEKFTSNHKTLKFIKVPGIKIDEIETLCKCFVNNFSKVILNE